ncbi:hypothetical protein SAMN04488003_1053 [Loktanella fryxellensis]|uniref:Uncharacterized protein n=1 Tax=Loktanella fryxellensis TaxID=245187 RepID=A0A1H8BD24_9RHOB|nr:hypothetical protein SAMN04488003_1053 [Loktanella fryxellensis]
MVGKVRRGAMGKGPFEGSFLFEHIVLRVRNLATDHACAAPCNPHDRARSRARPVAPPIGGALPFTDDLCLTPCTARDTPPRTRRGDAQTANGPAQAIH